jgi:ubiquinone/menaquinone biosynthesis C-methylase UbiE
MKQRVYYYEDNTLKVMESISRYLFSLRFVKGKNVIDVGCGARKGPYIISEAASKVIGVDIIQEAIFYCTKKWPKSNIFYLPANAQLLPFKDEFFDCVLSFELIEHIDNYKNYLAEVHRILTNGGILIVSTPNRSVTSPRGILSNPDHVREFNLDEFKNILRNYFPSVTLYGQFPTEIVKKIEELNKKNYQYISKIPATIKKIIPDTMKELIIKKYLYYSAKLFKNLDEKKVDEKNFLITSENIDRAKHFIALCTK